MLESTRGKRIVRIQPRFVQEGEKIVILLPGDPDFPVPADQAIEGDTRIVLEQGRWWSQNPKRL